MPPIIKNWGFLIDVIINCLVKMHRSIVALASTHRSQAWIGSKKWPFLRNKSMIRKAFVQAINWIVQFFVTLATKRHGFLLLMYSMSGLYLVEAKVLVVVHLRAKAKNVVAKSRHHLEWGCVNKTGVHERDKYRWMRLRGWWWPHYMEWLMTEKAITC